MPAPSTRGVRDPAESVRAVVGGLVAHPVERLVRAWNWKSAVLSSAFRSALFFGTNLTAGIDAAVAAMTTELAFRASTAGFYGALTQAFRRAEPEWLATLTAVAVVPAATHVVEGLVHWSRGTVNLRASILSSMAFTIASTLFNVFAMRRGAFIVGEGRASLGADLVRLPRLVAAFLRAAVTPAKAAR